MNFLWREEEEQEDTLKDQYLTLSIEKQLFAIGIEEVIEIIGMQDISGVPEFPPYAKGIINLRGKIIPIIDVRLRFGLSEAEHTDRTCIVVVDINGFLVGLIVERVNEVTEIAEELISEAPTYREGFHSRFLSGVGRMGEEVILIINADQLVNDEELNVLYRH